MADARGRRCALLSARVPVETARWESYARHMRRLLHADHVGSLLRPSELLAAREQFAHGTLSEEALREREDAAILRALEHQKQVGLEIFTDGEFRRASWFT